MAALGGGVFTPHEAHQARRLSIVLAVVGGFFVLELAGALVARSLVLQAEAVHLMTDVLALAVSLSAMRVAVRMPTHRFTYGLRRAEPVAALFSGGLVLATTGWIVLEAIRGLREPTPPRAGIMLVLASMTLMVNGSSAWLLHDAVNGVHPAHGDPMGHGEENQQKAPARRSAHGHALNLRAALLHLLGDALGAACALGAALVIRFGGSPAADPIAGLLVAAILAFASLRLLGDATLVLLEAAPRHLPVDAVRQVILGFPGVVELRELHVWTLGGGHDAVTAHVHVLNPDDSIGCRLAQRLKHVTGAEYVTVQVDLPAGPQGAT